MTQAGNYFAGMPGHLLRRCHQISVAIFLEECGEFDLTPLQYSVLSSLKYDGVQDQITIGGHTALDRTTVAVVIENLEKRGLLERQQSERDRRSKIVRITPSGLEIIENVAVGVQQTQQRMLEPLSESEAVLLLDLLQKMADGNNARSRAPQRTRRK